MPAAALALSLLTFSEPLRPILITVDDLPFTSVKVGDLTERRRLTDGLLAALAKHKIKAVALVTGKRVLEGDRALLEAWVGAGHELGNHSFSHLDYTETDVATFVADVERGRKLVDEILGARGKKTRFFRFPFLDEGDTSEKLDALRAQLTATAQRNLPVTIDDQDWSFEEPWLAAAAKKDNKALAAIGREYQVALDLAVRRAERIGDAVLGRRGPQILLLHATAIGGAEWDPLFTHLEETGHRFAGADEVLADPAFAIAHHYVGPKGFGLWDRIRVERRREETKGAITALLKEQAAAWTKGDLDAFCAVYADHARFLAPSGLTEGRQAILERYRKKYGKAPETMGALELEPIEVRLFDGWEGTIFGDAVPSKIHGATVIMRWKLRFPSKPEASGLSMIALEPKNDRWWIVSDASM